MVDNNQKKKIVFSGGGTGGSVTPLLAVAEEIISGRKEGLNIEWELVFVGTFQGPEKELVDNFCNQVGPLRFIPIISGKFRRYFSWSNILDLFKVFLAFFESFWLLYWESPNVIVSAGSFVSVPLVWAAAILRIPVLVHQSDVRPGLANRLSAPWAKVITVAFEKSLSDFPRAVHTGNPICCRQITETQKEAVIKKYNISLNKPLLLATGGGTGSVAINRLVSEAASRLSDCCQVIHITGRGKQTKNVSQSSSYQTFEFLAHDEVFILMSLSDLIISRCGLAFLTELSCLGKAAILIPMPDSHQEDNAKVFAVNKAAIVLNQSDLESGKLVELVNQLLTDKDRLDNLRVQAAKIMKRGGAKALADIIKKIAR